jgi:hypothetical protein
MPYYSRSSRSRSTGRRRSGYSTRSRSAYRTRRRRTARQQTVKIVLEHRQSAAPAVETLGLKPAAGPRKSSL